MQLFKLIYRAWHTAVVRNRDGLLYVEVVPAQVSIVRLK